MLNALPKIYKGFVQSLINKDELPPWGNIKAKLIAEKIKLKSEELDTADEAMMAQSYNPRPHHRMGPRFSPNFKGRSYRLERNYREFESGNRQTNCHISGKCDHYGQTGHWERECPLKAIEEHIHKLEIIKRELRRTEAHNIHNPQDDHEEDFQRRPHFKEQDDEHEDMARKTTRTEALLIEMMSQNQDHDVLAVEDSSTAWYLDSGASNHVIGTRSLLVDVKPTDHNRVVHTA